MATNVNITEPPEFLKSYYAALAERGMNAGNLGFTPYQQQRVAPWNDYQNAAAQMVQTRALQGSPAMGQANDYFTKSMRGDFLGSNPYLNNQISQAQDNVSSRVNSMFKNNAFGGTAHQQTLARELGNVDTQMRGQQYQFDRGLQQSAMGFAPTLAANDYADAQAMMNVGNQMQVNNQKIADANYQEFLRQQQYPGQQLQWMAQGLAPSAGAFQNSTSTNNQQTGGNTFANMAGGGALGYAAGNFFNVNPWIGALGGAALGGLL